MNSFILLCCLCVLSGLTNAVEEQQQQSGRGFSRDCAKSYSLTCLKLDVVSFVEKMSENDNYSLLPGINVIREKDVSETKTSDLVSDLAREFPNDAEARLDAFLLKKIEGYLNTHSIRFKLMDKQSVAAARALVDETGRGKKNKGMGAALLAGMMMVKGTLIPIAMGGLAMLAGKALMTGLLSLMLSAIIGLKALTSGGHKSTTYEIVSKPVYTSSHTHSTSHEDHSGGYGGYGHGRSYNEQPASVVQPIKFELPQSVILNKMN
ncbi:uncharacterized protein LOC123291151 [Chrysoperla carnea]|uniref:uncharacterized protein LOC123291151 n=1 Tax=Chrysoperla carnea TaxID=189513 RepID=UPI001D061687|nr:uncharacterized protein LOC123291151 [Chrysoperla carnea]